MKNRVPNFDTFVRLDEQLGNSEASIKMIKAKLKSAAYNASSALSLLETNPTAEIDPTILAQVAVAADYLDHTEEYFRTLEDTVGADMGMGAEMGMEAGAEVSMEDPEGAGLPPDVSDDGMEPEDSTEDEDMDEPGETEDDESEDEIDEPKGKEDEEE